MWALFVCWWWFPCSIFWFYKQVLSLSSKLSIIHSSLIDSALVSWNKTFKRHLLLPVNTSRILKPFLRVFALLWCFPKSAHTQSPARENPVKGGHVGHLSACLLLLGPGFWQPHGRRTIFLFHGNIVVFIGLVEVWSPC